MIKPLRKIIHIDMDAFYASVEQRDHPELRNKPVAVGGSGLRGVVAAASYEARKFGVHSAMPSKIALRKCPNLIFVKSSFDVYRAVSRQIMGIFRDYTDLVEPLSLDEAYLDVTLNKCSIPCATAIAREIRSRIRLETNLTASAGVSYNKFLAKVASDMDKPDGLTVITPDQAEAFICKLPVKKFHGIGKVTAAKMEKMGIHTGADLKARTETELVHFFGKSGHYFYKVVQGFDDREVKPHRIRKSIGAERTYESDIDNEQTLILKLSKIAEILEERIKKVGRGGRTITLKIKYNDFVVNTRSKSVNHCIGSRSEIMPLALDLLKTPNLPDRPVRLLGLTVSNLEQSRNDDCHQLGLEIH